MVSAPPTSAPSGALQPGAYAAALTRLPEAGPTRIGRLLGATGDPSSAWKAVCGGTGEALAGVTTRGGATGDLGWAAAARAEDVGGRWERLCRAGISVTWVGDAAYPAALIGDPLPPAVVFWRGDLRALDRACVAIVGTRRATATGREIAFDLSRDLAAAGVCVVSGLAMGIDGAAHRGALSAGGPGTTVGVAASGVDYPYPRRHIELWEAVVGTGAVLSETPPGRPPEAWRFPARNRIIAGLVSMVVVVESHAAGGSLITADAAIERGIDVRAVPGPVRSPASAGSNQLLFDGPGPIRDATDVLVALGLDTAGVRPATRPAEARAGVRPATRPARSRTGAESTSGEAGAGTESTSGEAGAGTEPSAAEARVAKRSRTGATPSPPTAEPTDPVTRSVLAAVGWAPTSLNRVVVASGRTVAEVARALNELREAGWVNVEGSWWQRRR